MNTHFHRIAFVLALASMAALSPVLAGEQRATVAYSDVNLASREGAAVVMHRIAAASRIVCGPRPDLRDLERFAQFQACVAQSQKQAAAALPAGPHYAGQAVKANPAR